MKPPTMPLSTVAVLNKVSFVDLVTIPELRKFDFLTSKRTNNQSQEWQKSLVSGELALVHGATGATGLAAVQVFNVLHMLKLFFFSWKIFLPQCHINNSSCARRSELMWSQRAAATRNWKWWSSKLSEKEGLNLRCFFLPRSTQCLALSLTF